MAGSAPTGTAEISKVQSTARARAPPAVGLGDVEAMDLVVDGDRADVPGLMSRPDRLDIGAPADADLRDAGCPQSAPSRAPPSR